jgi:type I restriction enzyme S subunit
MSKWTSCTVQELVDRDEAEVKTGPFGTQLHASDYVDAGIPVINVRNIGFGGIRPEKLEYISEETAKRLSSHLLKPKDIVFGRKGAVERHVFIQNGQDRWFQGSDCLRLRVTGSSVDPRYVSYSFLSEDHKSWMMNQCSHGATMASLNQDIVKRIPLLLPPLETQRKIASILSAYDDLIENNTRRIKILEEMARMIYREWFVNFRFPGHEQVKMVDSLLGMIPEGWEVKLLGEVCSVIKRGVSPKYNDSSESIVINQKCIRDFRLSLKDSRKHNSKVPAEKYLVQGDVLINSTGVGTLGRVAQVLQDIKDCTADSHVTIVRPKESVDADFLGLQLFDLQGYFESLGQGATGQTELGRESIANTEVIVAKKDIQEIFSATVKPMRWLAKRLAEKNEVLRQTRDLLLPKLISGEVDVSDMTIEIKEAAA